MTTFKFGLVEVDVTTATHFHSLHAGCGPLAPERQLMLAVLHDAIACLQNCSKYAAGSRRRAFNEAMEWILACDYESPFSFQNICEMLNFEPNYIRSGLLAQLSKLTKSADSASARIGMTTMARR